MYMNRCIILMQLLILPAIAYASGTMPCPASIEVQEHAENVPKGWLAFAPSNKHPLLSIEFSEGVPTKGVVLLPTGEQGPSVSVWTFTPSTEGYWISCSYNNTGIVLSQKLPANTTTCQIAYDEDFTPPLPKSLKCIEDR